MTGKDYEEMWWELQWLKQNHQGKCKKIISMVERFYDFAEEERLKQKQQEKKETVKS